MNLYILCLLGVLLISIICGLIFIPAILRFCKKKNLYDAPGIRKIHKSSIPRLGGVCFMPSMFIAVLIVLKTETAPADISEIPIFDMSVRQQIIGTGAVRGQIDCPRNGPCQRVVRRIKMAIGRKGKYAVLGFPVNRRIDTLRQHHEIRRLFDHVSFASGVYRR